MPSTHAISVILLALSTAFVHMVGYCFPEKHSFLTQKAFHDLLISPFFSDPFQSPLAHAPFPRDLQL